MASSVASTAKAKAIGREIAVEKKTRSYSPIRKNKEENSQEDKNRTKNVGDMSKEEPKPSVFGESKN